MKRLAVVSSSIAGALTMLLLLAAPDAFAQAGGRGGGRAGAGGFSRGGSVGGRAGMGGVFGGGARPGAFSRPPGRFPHSGAFPRQHRHHGHFSTFGFGVGAFVPSWWWYDPYYYSGWPPAYYSTYYGYPYYDYSGSSYYDYYGYPYGSDPCLTSDPAYTPYCQPSSYPYQGDPGAPPVTYPSPTVPGQPGTGSVSPYPLAPEQPISPGSGQ